jgi:psiF repeat-containing protein
MLQRVLASMLAFGLVAAIVPPAPAASNTQMAEAASPKPLTPQQQKMKDCAAKWKEEKANTGVKGRAAYNKFMSECLKKTAT